jgi:vitamin B12 transporter
METPLNQVAGSVTLIEREEMERRGWRTLADALNEVPGMHAVQSGGVGTLTSFFMRGTNSNHTLILLDGFEISDPSFGNLFDGAHLLTENVERIEVLRGPQSTLYGSEALGGVINVVTRAGEGSAKASFWGEAGAHNTVQQAIAVRAKNFSISFSNLHSGGFTAFAEDLGGHERDGYDNRTLSVRLAFDLGDRVSLDLTGRFIDTDLEVDRVLDDERSRGATRQLLLGAQVSLDVIPDRWAQRLRLSLIDHDTKNRAEPSSVSVTDARSTGDGRRAMIEWLHDLYVLDGHTTTIGLVSENESIESRTTNISPFSAFQSRAHARAQTNAVFVQDQFVLGDRLSGSLGIRLDHHDDFGSHASYRVTAAYVDPTTGTRLRGSVGTAFKAPTLSDLFVESVFSLGGFDSLFVGNPNLDPEKSFGFEAGVDQSLFAGRVRLGVTYFQNRIRDLITTTPDFSTLENISKVKTDGFESYISVSVTPRLDFRADHTYTSAENRDTGRELLRRPSHKLAARLEVRPVEAATLSLGVIYTGHRKDIDALSFGRKSLPGYTVTRLAATYRIGERWKLFGRLENVFDRKYADPDGFQSPGFAGYFGLSAEF